MRTLPEEFPTRQRVSYSWWYLLEEPEVARDGLAMVWKTTAKVKRTPHKVLKGYWWFVFLYIFLRNLPTTLATAALVVAIIKY
jgi:hypothetical protein